MIKKPLQAQKSAKYKAKQAKAVPYVTAERVFFGDAFVLNTPFYSLLPETIRLTFCFFTKKVAERILAESNYTHHEKQFHVVGCFISP